jgi:hypothetical protein
MGWQSAFPAETGRISAPEAPDVAFTPGVVTRSQVRIDKLSPEFLLASACCCWPPAPARDAAVRARAVGIDWSRFLAVIRRQRVEGLAANALRRAGVEPPASMVGQLARAATGIARANLAFAAESRRIQRAFDGAGLPHLFVKGGTLDMLAYGTLALKRARDIDLVVVPEVVEQACRLMAGLEYQRVVPGPEVGEDRLGQWLANCKETNWRHRRSGLIVEIHSGLVDNPALLPDIGAHSPRQIVEIGPDIRLPTLRTEELFAYLCVHGATHAWSRLKWIADVAALLSGFDATEVERLYRASLRLGVGRCSAQALLLCHQLFETALPPSLLAELRSDRKAVWLARVALRTMAGRYVETELDDTVLGTVPIHLSHFALRPGWRYKLAEANRKMLSPHDRASMNLPPALGFLYPILLLPRWIGRRIRGPAPL